MAISFARTIPPQVSAKSAYVFIRSNVIAATILSIRSNSRSRYAAPFEGRRDAKT
nr:MAG TPA: hypothetical protein [Caudoviricetes sp.]